MEIPTLYEYEDGQPTGDTLHFCSDECRSTWQYDLYETHAFECDYEESVDEQDICPLCGRRIMAVLGEK
jgi:hypothetical protein